jgi:hypothetical protein
MTSFTHPPEKDRGRAMPTARAATPSGLSRFASSCQHRIAIAARYIGTFTAYAFRKSVPLLLCLAGGAFWKAATGWHSTPGLFVALLFWGFAIDLAMDRAAAKATKDAATRFYAMVTEDRYCEITVTNKHTYYADDATRAAMAADKARGEHS